MGQETNEEIGDIVGESVKETVIDAVVHGRAKPVASSGVDLVIIVVILALQYLRCNVPSSSDLIDAYNQKNETVDDFVAQYDSCDFNFTGERSVSFNIGSSLSVDLDETLGITLSITFIFLYAFIITVVVCVHSQCKFKKLSGVNPKIEKVYYWTDKFIIIDSILEIPITFLFAPILSLLLWLVVTGVLTTLFFASQEFAKREDAELAMSTFTTCCILLALSIFRFTGHVSQYIVLYKASFITAQQEEGEDDKVEGMLLKLKRYTKSTANKLDDKAVEALGKVSDYTRSKLSKITPSEK